MTVADQLALEIGTSGRSLRRAANKGTIRCRRVSERKLELEAAEERYIRLHWDVLADMVAVLRTQPNVRLAVLYGSLARGEERAESDVDILVRFANPSVHANALLADRVEQATGRNVQIVGWGNASRTPLLLSDVLRDGRVLVDRDGDWPRLKRRERALHREASEADERLTDDVLTALVELQS